MMQGGEGKVQSSPFCAGVTNKDTNPGVQHEHLAF